MPYVINIILGKNTHGQLGLNDTKSKSYPSQLRTLRNVKICYISCGDEFSTFLTLDGGVFSCGAGMYGQLGHGSTTNEIVPRKVNQLFHQLKLILFYLNIKFRF